jgi:hypothetical protein
LWRDTEKEREERGRERGEGGGRRGGGGKDNVFTHKEVFFELEVVQLSMTCAYPRGKWLVSTHVYVHVL